MDRPLQRAALVRLGPSLLVLSTVACSPSLEADAQWVQWFSYRQAVDIAVSSEGEAVIVGYTTGDEVTSFSPFGQSSWRPWIARVDATGAVVDEHVGFLGRASVVAMDDRDRAYVAVQGLRDDQYWGEPERCELRALDDDGEVRWSQSWSDGSCVYDMVVAGEVVVANVGVAWTLDSETSYTEHLEAFDLDGNLQWQQPLDMPLLEALRTRGPLAAAGDEIWVLGDHFETGRTMAWRFDARDGAKEELRARIGDDREFDRYVATPDGLLVMTWPSDVYQAPPWTLVSLDHEGNRRWEQQVVPQGDPNATGTWQGRWGWPFADGDDAWVVSSELRIDPSTDDVPRSTSHRMLLQRWSADGSPAGSLRQAFEEPSGDPLAEARNECPASDAESGPPMGSEPTGGAALDGAVWVMGRQGCRDAFLMKLEVE